MAHTSINIHHAADMHVESFQPENSMAIRLKAGGVSVAYFGMTPALAWALFDLFRNGDTGIHFGGQSIFRIGHDPQASADLIRRARDETLPHPDPEDDPIDTLRAFVAEAV